MTEYDRLPPDQHAVLSLVLERGRSYAEVAALLSIPEATVRDRAHAALDALARAGQPAPGAAHTDRDATYAAPDAIHTDRDATNAAPDAIRTDRDTTNAAPGAAATASDPAGKPAPDPGLPPLPPDREPVASISAARPGLAGERPQRAGSPPQALPSSRLGGALLLALIVVAAVVVAIVLSGGGKKGPASSASSTGSTAAAQSSSTAGSGSAHIEGKFALTPLDPESQATGEAYVLSDGSRHAFYVAAKGLPPSNGFFYAVWLYNSPSSSAPLGRAPTVTSNGRLEGGGPLPSNAADYAKLIVTRETSTHASHPGPIVLSGAFSLR